MPEYGHCVLIAFVSHAGSPGLGMQSNQSGQLRPCSQPQPQGFLNRVVFGGHVKAIASHCEASDETYSR